MPFTPPASQAFRRFVALDVDSIMAALSALDGGAVDAILEKRIDESGGEAGVGLRAGPAQGKAAKNKARRVEAEIQKVRTQHSAASTLIDRLHEASAVGVLDGSLDSDALAQLKPGMTIQARGQFRLHPLFQLEAVMQSFIRNAPALGLSKDAAELKEPLKIFQTLIGTRDGQGRLLVDIDTGPAQEARMIAFVRQTMLQVDVEDLVGEFTIVGQVDEIVDDESEPAMTLRLVRGASAGEDERQAMTDGLREMGVAAKDIGVAITDDDLFVKPPAVVLRPIAIWR